MRDLLKQSFALVGVIKALRQIPFDVRRALWCIGRDADIREYLDAHPVRKLQIGAGYNMLDGWLNVDFNPYTRQPGQLYLNATRRFPFADASLDYVFSEHMIDHIWWPDGQTMLKESHRILKPGGTFLFLEHGLAPEAKVQKWQHRIEPTWKVLMGGCHLTRPVKQSVAQAGFTVTPIDQGYMPKMPKFASWMEWGEAVKAG